MKRRMLAFLCIGMGLVTLAACSGQTTSSPSSNGGGGSSGSGGTGELGGSGGSSACPDDLEVRSGSACEGVAPGCASGSCLRAYGVWACASPCPCNGGWFCGWFGDRSGCVPGSLAGCVQPGGTGGSGGTGGAGGTGGVGGSGGTGFGGTGGTGFGGTGGTGGTGSGGTGPCGGEPACYGAEASFCSTDGARLLSCAPAEDCPTVTSCLSYCPACSCHMAPPVNGVLRGTCDTCTNDGECSSPLKCVDNPMFPGSGAKTCVAP